MIFAILQMLRLKARKCFPGGKLMLRIGEANLICLINILAMMG